LKRSADFFEESAMIARIGGIRVAEDHDSLAHAT